MTDASSTALATSNLVSVLPVSAAAVMFFQSNCDSRTSSSVVSISYFRSPQDDPCGGISASFQSDEGEHANAADVHLVVGSWRSPKKHRVLGLTGNSWVGTLATVITLLIILLIY